MARQSLEEKLNERDERRRSRVSGGGVEPARRRRRRWPYVLFVLLAILFLLPNLIGWLGLQQKVLDYVAKDFKGKLSIERVSLGWVQPIVMEKVTALDEQGQLLFQVDRLSSTKPLYNFVISSDYGQIDIERATGVILLRPDGSNLEDAFANYLTTTEPAANDTATPDSASSSSASLPKLKVNLIDGRAMVTALDSGESWQIDQIGAIADLSSPQAALMLDAQCQIAKVVTGTDGKPALQTQGGATLSSVVDSGSSQLTFNMAEVTLESQKLPLSLAAPIMRRWVGPTTTDGQLAGKIKASYDAKETALALDVERLDLAGLRFSAPELIGTDQIELEQVVANGNLNLSPELISAEQFNFKSDFGEVNAEGQFDVSQLAELGKHSSLLGTPFQMDGELDLARLIQTFPETLKLHEDLVVNSGVVKFMANSRTENGQRRMAVNLDTANLNARRGSQSIVWSKPLRLVGTVQEEQGMLSLEDIRCESDFLVLNGKANSQTGAFSAAGDLGKLTARIGQFVDLGELKMLGQLNGKFGWQAENVAARTADGFGPSASPIRILGSFNIDNPVIEMPGMPSWQEQQMTVKVSAIGKSAPDSLQLDQGGIQIDVGSEQLVAALDRPVSNAYTQKIWTANCRANGSLDRWMKHIRNFIDIGTFESAGNAQAVAHATLDANAIRLAELQYNVGEFGFDGYGVKIKEDKVSGEGEVFYDLNTGDIVFPRITLGSNSISAASEQLKISFPGNMRVDGDVGFKGDVNRISNWFGLSIAPDDIHWYGGLNGTVQLVSNEHGIGGKLTASIKDVVAAQQVLSSLDSDPNSGIIRTSQPKKVWEEIWREPTVDMGGKISLANDFNAIAFEGLSLNSNSLSARVDGIIADLANTMVTDLKGEWAPDWTQLNALIGSYTNRLVSIQGRGKESFVFKGPLFEAPNKSKPADAPQPWISPNLEAVSTFGWDQGSVAGLAVGKSRFQIQVQQSVGFIQTQGIPFAGGVVNMAPQLDMRSSNPALVMGQTRMLDNIQLRPETARQWLKYVAPLAAEATSAQGTITMDIEGLEIPLFEPTQLRTKGQIHLSNTVFGAGPAAEQLLATAKQLRQILKPGSEPKEIRTSITLENQTVPFIAQDGRVFHEDMKISHKDLTIRTSGSVGLDQSLDMVAKIQIHDDWIAGKPYLASLKGQSIPIPIRGTVTKPVIDRNVLQRVSQDLVKQAASGAFRGAIDSKLTPKIDEFRGEISNKLNGELGKLQEKFGGKLNPGQTPSNGQQPAGGIGQQLENKLQQELNKGIQNLFKKN